jgi:hypothetical protein
MARKLVVTLGSAVLFVAAVALRMAADEPFSVWPAEPTATVAAVMAGEPAST